MYIPTRGTSIEVMAEVDLGAIPVGRLKDGFIRLIETVTNGTSQYWIISNE
jgi:hypothetical protein